MKNRVGEKFVTNEGYHIEIIEYFGKNNCTIKFENNTQLQNLQYSNIKLGNVKNPYHPSVCRRGYFGIGHYKTKINTKNTKSYVVWHSMMTRCYNTTYHLKQPTYKDCVVDKSWYNYQVFAKWFEENYIEGFELDKDILVKGNKIYSPETCCFVPKEINTLLINCKSRRGLYPIGINKKDNCFQARLSVYGKRKYLGTFSTFEFAFQEYKKAKEFHIKNVIKKYIKIIPKPLYIILFNYVVDIND